MKREKRLAWLVRQAHHTDGYGLCRVCRYYYPDDGYTFDDEFCENPVFANKDIRIINGDCWAFQPRKGYTLGNVRKEYLEDHDEALHCTGDPGDSGLGDVATAVEAES